MAARSSVADVVFDEGDLLAIEQVLVIDEDPQARQSEITAEIIELVAASSGKI